MDPKLTSHQRRSCILALRKALIQVTEHPETWRQDSWGVVTSTSDGFDWNGGGGYPACGTAACLFGTGIVQAGMAEPVIVNEECDETILQVNAWGQLILAAHYNASPEHDLSQEFTWLGAFLFGLTTKEAVDLSAPDNTLAELWELAEEMTDGEIAWTPAIRARVLDIDAEILSQRYAYWQCGLEA